MEGEAYKDNGLKQELSYRCRFRRSGRDKPREMHVLWAGDTHPGHPVPTVAEESEICTNAIVITNGRDGNTTLCNPPLHVSPNGLATRQLTLG